MRAYDPRRGAANYLLKFQADPAWDVRFRNLELLSPLTPASAATSSRMMRKLRKCEERREKAATQPVAMKCPSPTQYDPEPMPSKGAVTERLGCLARGTVFPALRVVDKFGVDVKLRRP